MQLSLDVIDGFRHVSHYIASSFIGVNFSENVFGVAPINLMQKYQLTDNELQCIYGDHGIIAFSNIIPSKILSLEVDEPIKLREEDHDVTLDSWRNAGSTELKETHKWTEDITTTESISILTEIASAISAKVGAEYAGFKAELSAQISAKLGITENRSTQIHHSEEKTEEFIIAPWTSTSLVQKHSISDFKQLIKTHCELDANVRIYGTTWEKKFNSLKELSGYFTGEGGGSGSIPYLDDFVLQRKYKNFELPLSSFSVERERIYRNVKTGEVNRTEVPIKHE